MGVAAAKAVVPGAMPVTDPSPYADPSPWPSMLAPEYYKGFGIHWSGWILTANTMSAVGRWYAWPLPWGGYDTRTHDERPPYLQLTVPNFVGGPYPAGAMFDCSWRGSRIVLPETSEAQRVEWIKEGLIYIKLLADGFHRTTNEDLSRHWPTFEFPLKTRL